MQNSSRDMTTREQRDDAAHTSAGQSNFLAIVAHELRNPLLPIRNAAAILDRDALDPSVRRSAIRIIERQLDGMVRLINDLSDLAQLQRGSLELLLAPVTLGALIDRCVEMVAPFVAGHGHQLVVSVAAEPILLLADSMRICQALQNIVTNAAKYTDKGGEIRLHAYREGNEAVIVVRDNGIGIDPKQIDTIFDIYAQAGQAGARRSESGMGVGLFLTRYLLEAHHGRIVAASPGKGLGSEFIVRLPCEAGATTDAKLRATGAQRATGRIPF
jgi:signal transduction histidine kinase